MRLRSFIRNYPCNSMWGRPSGHRQQCPEAAIPKSMRPTFTVPTVPSSARRDERHCRPTTQATPGFSQVPRFSGECHRTCQAMRMPRANRQPHSKTGAEGGPTPNTKREAGGGRAKPVFRWEGSPARGCVVRLLRRLSPIRTSRRARAREASQRADPARNRAVEASACSLPAAGSIASVPRHEPDGLGGVER